MVVRLSILEPSSVQQRANTSNGRRQEEVDYKTNRISMIVHEGTEKLGKRLIRNPHAPSQYHQDAAYAQHTQKLINDCRSANGVIDSATSETSTCIADCGEPAITTLVFIRKTVITGRHLRKLVMSRPDLNTLTVLKVTR